MNRLIARVIQPRFDYPNQPDHQLARRLLAANLAWFILLIGVGLSLTTYLALTDEPLFASMALIPLAAIVAVIVHILLQRGRLAQARITFVLNVLFSVSITVLPIYQLDTPLIMLLTLPLTAAGVLLRRSGLAMIGLLLIGLLVLTGLTQQLLDLDAEPIGGIAIGVSATLHIAIATIATSMLMLWLFGQNLEEATQQAQQRSELLQLVLDFSQQLVALPAVGEELNEAVEQLRDAVGLYHAQIYLADPNSGLAVLRASTGFIGRRLLEEDSLLMPPENSPVNDALRRADPILITETDAEDQRIGFLPATRSELLLPLRVGDLFPLGVLDLHATTRDTFSPDVLSALRAVSNHLAAALYSTQQRDDLRASYDERDRLGTQIEGAQRELARLNRQLVSESWGDYLDTRRDQIAGFDWQAGTVRPATADFPTLNATLNDGQSRRHLESNVQVLSVPIRLRGETLGAVEFRRQADSPWSESALELAQAVAERLALSLENARLFEQAQTTAQREQVVNQITSALQMNNDLENLLTVAATQFQDALGAVYTRVQLGLQTTGEANTATTSEPAQ